MSFTHHELVPSRNNQPILSRRIGGPSVTSFLPSHLLICNCLYTGLLDLTLSQPKISTALTDPIHHPQLQAFTARLLINHGLPKISIVQSRTHTDHSQRGTSQRKGDPHDPQWTFTALRGQTHPRSRAQSRDLHSLAIKPLRIRSFDRRAHHRNLTSSGLCWRNDALSSQSHKLMNPLP